MFVSHLISFCITYVNIWHLQEKYVSDFQRGFIHWHLGHPKKTSHLLLICHFSSKTWSHLVNSVLENTFGMCVRPAPSRSNKRLPRASLIASLCRYSGEWPLWGLRSAPGVRQVKHERMKFKGRHSIVDSSGKWPKSGMPERKKQHQRVKSQL